jgi:hypothetical protein
MSVQEGCLQSDDGAGGVEHGARGLHSGALAQRASDAGPRSVAGVHSLHPQLDHAGRRLPHLPQLLQDGRCGASILSQSYAAHAISGE